MELVAFDPEVLDGVWVYIVGGGFVMVSAFIPPVPSTTVFVALGALAGADGGPLPTLLVVAMVLGALAGDLLTYWFTKLVGHTRWGSNRGARRERAVSSATRRLRQRPYMFMLTSRFIPLGRLSSNIAATVAGYPLRAFTVFSLVSGLVWSMYAVGVGMLTRHWPNISTQVAVLIAIGASIILGWLVGKVSTWLLDRKTDKADPAVAL